MRVECQRKVARVLLDVMGDAGFALAGAGAIREHGLTDRPTEDVDLFAGAATTVEEFDTALTRGEDALRLNGYIVTRLRSFPVFARIHVEDPAGVAMDVDFAVDWRADPPVAMTIGPVLSERDAVAGKLSAVYTRAEVRDFLDLDAIRSSGRYSDADLLALGHEHDAGFDEVMFAQQLARVAAMSLTRPAQYGVDTEAFAGIQARLLSWSVALHDAHRPEP